MLCVWVWPWGLTYVLYRHFWLVRSTIFQSLGSTSCFFFLLRPPPPVPRLTAATGLLAWADANNSCCWTGVRYWLYGLTGIIPGDGAAGLLGLLACFWYLILHPTKYGIILNYCTKIDLSRACIYIYMFLEWKYHRWEGWRRTQRRLDWARRAAAFVTIEWLELVGTTEQDKIPPKKGDSRQTPSARQPQTMTRYY